MISLLIHGFLPVNARLLIAFGTAFYAITVFKSYQDVGLKIIKCCVQRTMFNLKRFRLQQDSDPGPQTYSFNLVLIAIKFPQDITKRLLSNDMHKNRNCEYCWTSVISQSAYQVYFGFILLL